MHINLYEQKEKAADALLEDVNEYVAMLLRVADLRKAEKEKIARELEETKELLDSAQGPKAMCISLQGQLDDQLSKNSMALRT